ncbi:hypothetical protein CcaverHIS002_0301920 [Cutaneotrichosporon cavernicola]|uniref:DUF775-domain-containing protein n=1 Tax=Cutaneotrichosporon cavernicola TaxID=279322 RepID=A0AA48I6D5_9TREE|nr:uncharacterized protein CcaverHIS019_0301870 [Cutaneotrichosporon cavernicola]BEI82324.1 hypothetical protein CcaverHIS002_0301920 [Cutaneotrichosporon cavernicola]BEI90117.1 hypothetical protein CcaverHIS019_0301870 [Cutaneotrichosporon cavernicola]BEI97895.1 hypothetical protein CcaverHIS631_0301940 [Cutaneotrichosporon cavernicola]
MFGAIVAGRLVQTNLQRIDDTHFVFTLERPYDINHLTVFLTGEMPFPDGYGATVHFAWPGGEYFLLGTLTNARPSAIYKVRGHLPPGVAPGTVANAPAQLGIEVATLGAVETAAQASAVQTGKGREVAQRVDVSLVAQKIVKNLFNYLHSFGGDVKLTPDTPIPLSVFQRWYDNFNRKITNDSGAAFLDRED